MVHHRSLRMNWKAKSIWLSGYGRPMPVFFAALADPDVFAPVYVDLGVVTWPGEIDLAPDAMHAEIKKNGIWRLR